MTRIHIVNPLKNVDQQIIWPSWKKIINNKFLELVHNKDRYLILYGGRGSSKSNFVAKKIVYRMLSSTYFRCVLIRNTSATIEESSYKEIKDAIEELKDKDGNSLAQFFTFNKSPLKITCTLNDNYIIARGCDDTTKLKSLSNFTTVWYEEDLINEEDFIRITTSIRTRKADYLQEIFTINPECEGDFNEHWFYKRFFSKYSLSNQSYKDFFIDEKNNKINYTVHHSMYKDNKWITDIFITMLENMKKTNTYYYSVFCLGQWGNKEVGQRAYKQFDYALHTSKLKYDDKLALHLSFDFNVKPYSAVTIYQVVNKTQILCIDEIALKYPNNSLKYVCQEFIRRYPKHTAGVFIYGDPSGKNQDTKSESGYNNYTFIYEHLINYRPQIRVATKHPNIIPRLQFINEIFQTNIFGLSITIDETNTELITDLKNQQETQDGAKDKSKAKVDGQYVEKYGHMSDTFDYFICECFKDDYKDYLKGPIDPNSKQAYVINLPNDRFNY